MERPGLARLAIGVLVLVGTYLAQLALFAARAPFQQTNYVRTDIPQYATDPKLTLLWPYAVPVKRIVDEKVRRVPPGELAVRRGARVRATDGRVGRVDE
ncbi:MAG: hypothetical protein ACE5M4_06540, partial [Anaerolineales bacterium]